ncbi:hypothetical protein [Microvirga zambiensis]|uniref:hypothetical protein n=1 Tax=Microvirga zambiensis TaxID=1402137 RepID=UPI00191E5221|nr:hypothetical protein [Microvirga zambiensis]
MPALCVGGCIDYTKHRDSVTMEAGDAIAWNKVIHTADPWPPYAADTNLAADGQRTAAVIQRYVRGGSAAAAPAPEPASAPPSGAAAPPAQ